MIIQGSAARYVEKYPLSPASRQYLHVIMLMLDALLLSFKCCSLSYLHSAPGYQQTPGSYYNVRCQEGNFLTSVNTIIVFIRIKIVNCSTKENDFS